jgi:uncharacterized protein YbbC (DUF1343 family)
MNNMKTFYHPMTSVASVVAAGFLVVASWVDAGMKPEPTSAVATGNVLTGIDVLARDDYRQLDGRRVGLITNHTGIDRSGTTTVERLYQAPNVTLVALFSPEHGFEGKLDIAKIDDSTNIQTGIPVFSLYGETRQPTPAMLNDIDTLVFDIQDIGTRFYTYISTLGLAMEAAAESGIRFVVLDRPNPITGSQVSGPVNDAGSESFTAFHRLPVRHGMTVAELARMFRSERALDLDLSVVGMEGWRRSDYFDRTGLRWVNPSPNMRSLTQALLYPGIGLLETTNLSVGRGTNTPFELVGAPWLDGERFARDLNALNLPGVAFVPVRFTPDASNFSGEDCGGVNIIVTDRATFEPLRSGLEMAALLRRSYPVAWDVEAYQRLLVNAESLGHIRRGARFDIIETDYRDALEQFLERRAPHLIYP